MDSLPSPEISPVHIWRDATGGGLPVDYLRWLAAQWELYLADPVYDAGFNEWLAARFSSPFDNPSVAP